MVLRNEALIELVQELADRLDSRQCTPQKFTEQGFRSDSIISALKFHVGDAEQGAFFDAPKSIDFSKNILPDFVESIYGFSSPEKIGRWTNADIARVIFRDPLPKILRIEVLARANGFNINQPILVVVGSDAHIFWPKSFEPHSYELVFNCRAPGRMIEFFVPHAISQQHLTGGQSSDSRRIGLGIHSITVGKTQLPSVRKKGFLSSLLGRFRHASMVS